MSTEPACSLCGKPSASDPAGCIRCWGSMLDEAAIRAFAALANPAIDAGRIDPDRLNETLRACSDS